MKIISKIRDYYDGAADQIDPSFHYIRDERVLKNETEYSIPFRSPNLANKKDHPEDFILIFFCGVIYCGMFINNKWFYNEGASALLPPKKKRSAWWSRWAETHLDRHSKKSFFEKAGKDCHAVNLKYGSPIVALFWSTGGRDSDAIKIDCNLNQYNFASIVDPFQARQSIEQFLRNDLAKELNIPLTISDKDRIRAHGFDIKTSFRKDTPPKRKQKNDSN